MAASTRNKILFAVGTLVGIAALIGAALLINPQLQFQITGKYRAYDLVGQLAPQVSAHDALTGREVGLGELRGKPTLLVFCATRCSVCKKQMPELMEFRNTEVGQATNVVVAQGLEFGKMPVVNRQRLTLLYLKKNGWESMPAWIASKEMQKAFELQATPTLYVLDRDGRIVYAGLSDHSAARLEGIVEDYL